MQIRLPETYEDARYVLEAAFKNKIFTKGLYGTIKKNPCTITHIQIHDKKDKEEIGSITMDISYKERVINKYDKFEEKKTVQTLQILTPRGDSFWPFNLVVKVWEGKYPTSVLIDIKRSTVYLLNLTDTKAELIEYAHLTENEIEAITQDLNEREPYKIKLDEVAMFDYIAEYEGIRGLQRSTYIELDCGVRFRVTNNLSKE